MYYVQIMPFFYLNKVPHELKPWKFFSLDHTEEVPDGEIVRLEVEQQLVPVNLRHLETSSTATHSHK